MAQVAFDTLKFVKKLEQAGVPPIQAEALSEAVRESHEAIDVATKRDLDDVRKDLEAKIDKLGLQLTVRLGSMLVVGIGVIAAIGKMPL